MSCEPWMLPLGARSHPGAVVLTTLGSHALCRSFIVLTARQPSPPLKLHPTAPACEGPASCHLSTLPALRARFRFAGYNLAWPRRRPQFHLAVEPCGPRRRPPLPRLATEE
ncbi:hypothetical protein GQ55_4G041000 [Panicum hallii var. hallii]|uniref:Uncharacterized protein n=1 Tax=Panicum hallii var. hallii TaxID=1504633 RepID=A0A2T7DV35_9POAL|nr:hypothetical protein GQ55_4G041000 [Panicum hallii var. hallii]